MIRASRFARIALRIACATKAPTTTLRKEKSAQGGSFGDGYPADIRGSFARISRPKTSVRALKILEKNKHLGADIHDPKARTSTTLRDFQKLRSEKLWAEFSFSKHWDALRSLWGLRAQKTTSLGPLVWNSWQVFRARYAHRGLPVCMMFDTREALKDHF